MNGYTTTIDDEFASLFLQELQNTRSESIRNDRNDNLSDDLIGGGNGNGNITNDNDNASTTTPVTGNTNIDYINSIDLDTNTNNLMVMSGAASYARYLPLETTFSTNFFEFNDIYEPTQPQNDDHNARSLSSRMTQSELARSQSSVNVFAIDMPAKDDVSLENTPGIDPSQSTFNILGKTENDADYNVRIMQAISDYVLSLQDVSSSSDSPLSKLNLHCRGNISGRLFIDPESYNKLTNDPKLLNSKDATDLIQLYCYRRNSITVNFSMELRSFIDSSTKEQLFDKISIQIFSSLRKRDNKELKKLNMIKEEFKFHGFQDKIISNTIQMNQSDISIGYDDLLKIFSNGNLDMEFNWEQVRFNSATASNRHDIANKYHTLVLELNFLDAAGSVLFNKTFESHPIIVRGRNPRFYSEKGDILIGKIKKISNDIRNTDDLESTPAPHTTKRSKAQDNSKVDETSGNFENKSADADSDKASQSISVANEDGSSVSDDDGDNINCMSSSYQYFKVEDNYYLPPVEVGYFPHHVHHNKQVFKTNVIPPGINNGLEIKRQYNYFL